MKAVRLLIYMQIDDPFEAHYGKHSLLNEGTVLRVALDQRNIGHDKIRLVHPDGYNIVCSRHHCTVPVETVGKSIPELYAHESFPATIHELTCWWIRIEESLRDTLQPIKPRQ